MPHPSKPHTKSQRFWAQLLCGLGPCVGFASHSLEASDFGPFVLRFNLNLSLVEPLLT